MIEALVLYAFVGAIVAALRLAPERLSRVPGLADMFRGDFAFYCFVFVVTLLAWPLCLMHDAIEWFLGSARK